MPLRAQAGKENVAASDGVGDSGVSRDRPAIVNREFLQAALRSEKGVGLVILAVLTGAVQSLGKVIPLRTAPAALSYPL